jgi:hypothetical protein
MHEFSKQAGYISVGLHGIMTFDAALAVLIAMMEECVQQGFGKVLVDSRKLEGFDPPNVVQRYTLGESLSRICVGKVALALVTRPENIDERRFGVTVATNRGMVVQVFDNYEDAEKWLVGRPQPAMRAV